MNAPLFLDKASTLAQLEGRLTTARVLPQTTLEAARWLADREASLDAIEALPWAQANKSGARPLIVRSSAKGEDAEGGSQAGHFTSVQNVTGRPALARAIETVFASYGAGIDPAEKVLVQPMLSQVIASGVATSREVGSGRPYFVINISEGDDTTVVTAGRSNDAEVCYHFRGALGTPPDRCGAIVRLLREIENLSGLTRLDVEFAFVDGERLPVLLQARPLAHGNAGSIPRDRHCRLLAQAEEKVAAALGGHPLARGRRSALGVMPDWNPAEMIGVRPRPLALSLYRSLVTDEVWAEQRSRYGYRDLRGFPLLIDVLGIPFIDVRASFTSFVPAALPEAEAEALVDHYLERLIAAPALHDKIEFEIVLSCYAFDIDDKLDGLRRAGLPPAALARLKTALHALTHRVLDPAAGPRLDDRNGLVALAERRDRIVRSEMAPLAKAYWLIEDCRRLGTQPFAGLARVGFIAIQLLNSLVAVGAVDETDRQAFLMGVTTVASEMQRDLAGLPRAAFLERYGHLRPGAYDILSPRYDEAPDLYFGAAAPQPADATAERARRGVRARLRHAIAPLLRAHRFEIEPERFLDFLAEGVRERERAKFMFTRNLSDALVQLNAWGERAGLGPEDLSYADVHVLRECYASAKDPMELFGESIRQGRERHAATQVTCLPPLIVEPSEVWSFSLPAATPNFVTARVAQGPVVKELDRTRLAGSIVLIPNADPGFDWVFAHKIHGLVTAYGGANSHMAIRAAELDLPAVIGAGERLYGQWAQARSLKIDCANRRVDILPM